MLYSFIFQFSFGSGVDGSRGVFDVCGWGVLTYIVLQLLPGLVATHRLNKIASR